MTHWEILIIYFYNKNNFSRRNGQVGRWVERTHSQNVACAGSQEETAQSPGPTKQWYISEKFYEIAFRFPKNSAHVILFISEMKILDEIDLIKMSYH